ncbi:hypothetical protein BBJ28_00016772 [Nothophytophthora sp. Chile5]|nr:hypothetical protein BBJ28_00016772 [Nothophytophthora sp. Chile5]
MQCTLYFDRIMNTIIEVLLAYICKYSMKNQHPLENGIAYSLAAFNKAASKPSKVGPNVPAADRGYKIFSSMLYTVTNGQEVAAPMAALYLLRSPFWFSHEMTYVNMEKLLDKASPTQEIRVFAGSRGSDTFFFDSLSVLEKYWQRSPEMENVNFATICEQYDLKKVKKTTVNTASQLRFVEYKMGSSRKELILSGKQLPDRSLELSPEDMFFYYLVVLTLFKPHRKGTLLSDHDSVESVYVSFMHSSAIAAVTALQHFEANWLDVYKSQQNDDGDEESAEAELLRICAPPKSWWWYEPDCEELNTSDGVCDDEPNDANEFVALDIDGEKSMKRDFEIVHSDYDLYDVISNTCRAYPQVAENFSAPHLAMTDYFAKVITSERRLDERETMGTSLFVAAFVNTPTRLECLVECFEPVPWPNRGLPESDVVSELDLPMFPKIVEVSTACRLNFWQHVMFEMAARYLLYAYLKDIESETKESLFSSSTRRDPYAIKDQLVGYMGGEAGTGKSRVIHAILTFAEKWSRVAYVEPRDTASKYNHAGYDAYSVISFVIFLTENMRARVDPNYCEILSEIRWGNVQQDNLDLLNTRLHAQTSSDDDRSAELPFYRPIVTTTNKLRCAFNKTMLFDVAERTRADIYECRAQSNARSKAIFDKIINFNDDITGRVAMRLYFFIGMPEMVTRKHPQLKDSEVIANGTVVAETILMRLIHPSDLLFIRVHGCTKTLVRDIPPGVIGIPVMAFQIKPQTPNLARTTIIVRQFPLVPAFASTTEKLQGQTCADGIVVTKLERNGGVPPQSLYVALSRTVALEKLTLITMLMAEF